MLLALLRVRAAWPSTASPAGWSCWVGWRGSPERRTFTVPKCDEKLLRMRN